MKLNKILNDLELELAKILCLFLRSNIKDLNNFYLTGLHKTPPQKEDYISMLDNAIAKYNLTKILF